MSKSKLNNVVVAAIIWRQAHLKVHSAPHPEASEPLANAEIALSHAVAEFLGERPAVQR